jgi:hypothetical protein
MWLSRAHSVGQQMNLIGYALMVQSVGHEHEGLVTNLGVSGTQCPSTSSRY